MSLYGGAVRRPIMTTLCFVTVVILGLFSLAKLPIDLYPDIDTNTLMVITMYPGASAEDIEQNVTKPLENTLNSVEHLKHITSQSRENTSVITLEFEYGYDIDVLTNDVRDKLDMVKSSLPDDSENPIIFKFSTDMIPICLLSVEATESMPGLYKILDDNVANPLARVDGVGSVSITGAPKREVHIYVDPNRLEAYNLSVEQISNVIGAENRNVPGGSFDIGSNTYSLRVKGEFAETDEIENIPIGSYQGKIVYLRDVARVDDSLEERTQQTFIGGKEGAMIIIQKQSGANSVQISEKVMEMLPRLQKNLPSDVKIGVIVDTSDNIRNTIASLEETVLYALLFVMIVVFVFLGRWRATMIIVITIPVSLIASFIYLFATGNTLNIPNDGLIPSASIAVKRADGSALRGVTYRVELSNNSYPNDDDWCKITPRSNALQFIVEPYEGKNEAARTIDVLLTGSGEGISINPLAFRVVQAPTPKSAEAHILAFSIPEQATAADIDYQAMTISVLVPFGTDVTKLTPTIEVSAGATVTPASGAAQNFSSPVTYKVTAEDGITAQEYTAKVVVDKEKSHEAKILEFTVSGQVGQSKIGERTIDVVMKAGSVLSALAPVVKVSDGAKVTPASGQTSDFTKPVIYTVTAEDTKTTQDYTCLLYTSDAADD